jgi:pimeloyl-ACP methyl ester carboxylesterase
MQTEPTTNPDTARPSLAIRVRRLISDFARHRIVSRWALVRLALLAVLIYACFDPIVRFNMFPGAEGAPLQIDPTLERAYSAERLTLDTDAGDRISALHLRGGTGGLAIYFHGNAEELATAQYQLIDFAERGFEVLALDYPGYGESTGSPTREANLAAARALLDYGAKTLGYPPERTVYVGYSIGTAVALALADERPPAGIVLFAPFTSDRDMAREMFKFDIYGLFGQDARYPSVDVLERRRLPLFIAQGTADEVIPFRMGQEMYARANTELKWFVSLPDVGHNDLFDHLDTPDFRRAMEEFLRSMKIPVNEQKHD